MVSETPSTQKQKTQTGGFKNIESKLKKIEPVYMAGDINNKTIKTKNRSGELNNIFQQTHEQFIIILSKAGLYSREGTQSSSLTYYLLGYFYEAHRIDRLPSRTTRGHCSCSCAAGA